MRKYTTSNPSAPAPRPLSITIRALLARLAIAGAIAASASLGYGTLSATAPTVHSAPAHAMTASTGPMSQCDAGMWGC